MNDDEAKDIKRKLKEAIAERTYLRDLTPEAREEAGMDENEYRRRIFEANQVIINYESPSY